MTKPGLYTTTAISLCLSLHAGSSFAQVSELSADDMEMFTPAVQECLASPAGARTCLTLRAVIEDCATDIGSAACEAVIADDPALLDDPLAQDRAQQILAELGETLQMIEADLLPDSTTSDEVASEDADFEDLEDPAADPAGMDEPEVAADPEPEAEQDPSLGETIASQLQDLIGTEDRSIPDTEPEPDTTAAEMTEDETAPVAEADPAADASDTSLDDLSRALEDMMRAQDADAPDAIVEDPSDLQDERAAELAAEIEMERALEEERQRMIREAEAMADEAPELIVEDAPDADIVVPIEAPRDLDAAQQATIDQLMQSPDVSTALGVLGAALGVAPEPGTAEEDADPRPLAARLHDAVPEDAQEDSVVPESDDVTEEQITREQLRTSRDDFLSRLTLDVDADAQARSDRRSQNRRDLERAGLVALGALAVGMIVNQNRVVARSDERVVVDQGDGTLGLWRDDDAILSQEGSTRRIERYDDGSTRTRWIRPDGTETITIRDVTGRVLRRERVLADGTIIVLLDDTRPADVIDVSILPPPRTRELRISPRTDPDLAIALLREAEADARALDRRFSLRQVRDTREVRELVPLLSPDPITFETNRANVRPEEAAKLLQVGRLMERLVAEDPRELFLIEGHTDATGPAAFNLALSDRRAESVALALTEFFDIPPENLIVQGYGKRYLRIPTLESEVRNRRVAIRRITPLLW